MKKVQFQHPALAYCPENGYDETTGEEANDFIYVNGIMIVCPVCNGTGSHTRRDIDDSALVQSMQEDGDDEGLDLYHSGAFDVVCTKCYGKNVVFEPNWNEVPEWARKAMDQWNADEADDRRYAAQERAMGA